MSGDYRGRVSIAPLSGGDYLGSVSIVGGVPASEITGLTPQQVLFGAADGHIQQSPSLIFDTATNRQTVTRELISETSTGNTAGVERIALNVQQSATFNTGAITTQRTTVFSSPTLAFAGASLVTNAATVAIAGAPVAGTNATITNAYSLWIQGGRARLDAGLESRGSAGSSSTVIGLSATASNANTIAVGESSFASGLSASALGSGANAAGAGAIAIGRSANAAQGGALAVGVGATTNAANQGVFGGPTSFGTSLSSVYFGSGVVDTAPTSTSINATGGSGANIAGASLTLAGGKGTGNAAPGSVRFSTSVVGAPGSTLQSLQERARFDGAGNFLLGRTSGDTAAQAIAIEVGGVPPTTPGNAIWFHTQDGSSLNNLLNITGSEPVNGSAGVSDAKYPIVINGQEYYILLELIP